jgi:hypothetical protein
MDPELIDSLERLTPNLGTFTIEREFWDHWRFTDPRCWYHIIGSMVDELTPLLSALDGSVGSQCELSDDESDHYLGVELNASDVTVTFARATIPFEDFRKACSAGRQGFCI